MQNPKFGSQKVSFNTLKCKQITPILQGDQQAKCIKCGKNFIYTNAYNSLHNIEEEEPEKLAKPVSFMMGEDKPMDRKVETSKYKLLVQCNDCQEKNSPDYAYHRNENSISTQLND